MDQWAIPWTMVPSEQLPEMKAVSIATMIDPDEWFNRFSSYTNLIRVAARMRRFIRRCRHQQVPNLFLSSSELQDALLVIVRSSQSWSLANLHISLSRGLPVSRTLA